MPRRNKRNRPNKPRAQAPRLNTQMYQRLLDTQMAQSIRPIADTPDVAKVRLRQSKVFPIRKTGAGPRIDLLSTGPTFGAINFTLANVPGSSDMTSLFDQYRIVQVTVKFLPRSTLITGLNTRAADLPPLYTAIDLDDSSTPSSLDELLQYDTLQVTPSGTFIERTVNPCFALASYSGAFTSYASSRAWCDVASPTIQWYGIKYGLDGSAVNGGNVVAYYETQIEYTIHLRGVR